MKGKFFNCDCSAEGLYVEYDIEVIGNIFETPELLEKL